MCIRDRTGPGSQTIPCLQNIKKTLVSLLPQYIRTDQRTSLQSRHTIPLCWKIHTSSSRYLLHFLPASKPPAQSPDSRFPWGYVQTHSIAAHGIHTPYPVSYTHLMVANTDILTDNQSLDEPAKQAVSVIETECMRLSRLVKDMLLLASSDAKTWTLHQSQVNIDTLLILLYETYEQTCIKNGIQLKVNLSEDTYPVLNTDKDRLFQILCIFIDNAIQHATDNSLLRCV